MQSFVRLSSAARRQAYAPVWSLGFRPFFLGAGLWAVILLTVWVLVLTGRMQLAQANPVAWHGHEMVFGYTVAVIAGFLLTAARNWTGLPTPFGKQLAALFALWFAGRVAMLLDLPEGLAAAIDAVFLPVLCFAVARPIVKSRNWRNLGFVPMLVGLAALNILFHVAPEFGSRALYAAVDMVLVMITLIGGRIVPGFTQNALAGVKVVRQPWLDWAALGVTVLLIPFDLLGFEHGITAAAFAAGFFHLLRMSGWKSFATFKSPILWVLHVGYAWVPVGLLLRSLPALFPGPAALHALTVGAIGMLTLGMMARVALGHTGRPLKVAPAITAAFVLLCLAVLVRVFGPVAAPEAIVVVHGIAGTAWALAFLLFLWIYAPILLRPRADGRPG